jgi:hypothetical protein
VGAMGASPGPGRLVRRDEELGPAAEGAAGKGTYLDEGVVRALYDGRFIIEDEEYRVMRERRPLPRRRLRKGETSADPMGSRRTQEAIREGVTHRHGAGKHGRVRGKKKKGMGDQGTWD